MDKIAEILKQLADKLGTTVEHLWWVLVRQATVSFWSDVIWDTIILAGIIVSAVIVVKLVRRAKRLWAEAKNPNEYKHFRDEGEKFDFSLSIIVSVLLTVMSTIFLIGLLCSFEGTVTKRYNPEYWALQQVTQLLK